MRTWAVIATGASMKPDPAAVAARVRHLHCVAVNDAFRIAPFARALVFCDPTWFQRHRPDVIAFAGEKWCGNPISAPGVSRLPPAPAIFTNTNSGLLGLHFAVTHGATRVLLLGVDMKGEHYFGRHPSPLMNTEDETRVDKWAVFRAQFTDYAKRIPGVEVLNCNPDSALEAFPKVTLDAALRNMEAVCES